MINATFLTIHTRYNDVQIGLYKNNELLEIFTEDNKKISKSFFYILENLLKKSKINPNELSFIAAHTGPVVYTTLRVVLASINGCSFVKKIPLIGVNGLDALLQQHKSADALSIAILNAFGSEVYFGINEPNNLQNILGSAPIEQFLSDIKNSYKDQKIKFFGNGVNLHKELIQKILPHADVDSSIEIASIESIASMALNIYEEQAEQTFELMPVYLK